MEKQRNYNGKGGKVKRPKDIGFDDALKYLKRKFKVARAQWPGFHLELVTDKNGDAQILNIAEGNSHGVRHQFDQTEIMAHDWRVL